MKQRHQTLERINETKSKFFEKINKIEKTFYSLKERQKTQRNEIRSERGEITMDTTENTKDYKRILWKAICQTNG